MRLLSIIDDPPLQCYKQQKILLSKRHVTVKVINTQNVLEEVLEIIILERMQVPLLYLIFPLLLLQSIFF